MEISEPTMGIFFISKFLGLAPFAVHRNSKGILDIRRSILFGVYSASLSLIMVFLTYRGLLYDANSKIPIRMKSATSKVVTALDVSVVVMATMAGVLCGLLGVNSTKELNKRLQKIDESLHSFANLKTDRIRSVVMVVVPLSSISILLGSLDVWTWIRFAQEMQIDDENTDLNVQWYIPFYSLYYILTGLHISFANTAFGLGRRYKHLNLMLRNLFLFESSQKMDLNIKPKVTIVKTILENQSVFNTTAMKTATDYIYSDGIASKKQCHLIKYLAENHESLGKCVKLVSGSYGISVLFILVSCLLHLVATAYFLFLEFLSKKDNGYLWLQVLWIIFHTFRLLMVVEPCHLATNESRKAIQIICEIERKSHDPIMAEEIKKFWQQLLVSDSEFSAMGLCKVNRNILTSFSSAIATYLVILIQFQKTNG